MQSFSPLAIPAIVVLAVSILIALTAFVRDRRRFSGYSEIAEDARELGRKLNGEVFRDGVDLVVNGSARGLPVQVRFSNADNMPGLDIRLGAPANFNVFLSPRSAHATEGRHLVRSSDEMMNARVEARSDQPTQARLLLTTTSVTAALSSLCRTANTFVRVTRGVVELIDLAPPTYATVRSVPAQLAAMQAIVEEIKQMPGADTVKVEPLKRERRYLMKTVLAAGMMAVVAAVFIGVSMNADTTEQGPGPADPNSIPKDDASLIPSSGSWRVAAAENFGADEMAWLHATGIQISGRIQANFSGKNSPNDVAYVLIKTSGEKRVVILSGGIVVLDSRYPYVGIAARVPQQALSSIEWSGAPPDKPAGDGLLIVRTPNDRASGLIIFLQGGQAISAVPKDYQSVRLE